MQASLEVSQEELFSARARLEEHRALLKLSATYERYALQEARLAHLTSRLAASERQRMQLRHWAESALGPGWLAAQGIPDDLLSEAPLAPGSPGSQGVALLQGGVPLPASPKGPLPPPLAVGPAIRRMRESMLAVSHAASRVSPSLCSSDLDTCVAALCKSGQRDAEGEAHSSLRHVCDTSPGRLDQSPDGSVSRKPLKVIAMQQACGGAQLQGCLEPGTPRVSAHGDGGCLLSAT